MKTMKSMKKNLVGKKESPHALHVFMVQTN